MLVAAPFRILMILFASAELASAQDASPIFEGKIMDIALCDGILNQSGRWSSRLVQVLADGNKLELKEFVVFDPEPDRSLEFLWQPDDTSRVQSGRVSGSGSLVWRDRLHMAWDPAGVAKSFVGDMRNGKPEGNGEFITAEGLAYRGAWHQGRPNGAGQLQLTSGEIYRGQFRSGCANGRGEFIDTTNEKFEGQFRDGKRDGQGKTILPSGYSYTSNWSRGVEDPGSQRIRVAQLNQNMNLPGQDVRMGVTVQRRPELPDEVSISDVITYSSTPTESGILVQPTNKNLVSAWKGDGQIQVRTEDQGELHSGMFYYDKAFVKSTAPSFIVNVQNRTSDRIQIASLRIDVSESRSDLQPAIQMLYLGEGGCGSYYSTSFSFDNYGWSTAKATKVNYTFGQIRGAGESPLSGQVSIGDIKDSKEMSFDSELIKFGVNVRKLSPPSPDGGLSTGMEFPCSSGNLEKCLDKIRDNPIFGKIGKFLSVSESEILLPVKGTIEYTWTDDQSASHSRVSPYRVSLAIAHFRILAECGEGPTPRAIKHAPLHLRLSGTNYTLAVPFRTAVEAGQSARYTLRLEADESSNHTFTIVAVLANGEEIASRPVSLLYFRPRPLPN